MIAPRPSRSPAAPLRQIAVSSKGPCPTTNESRFIPEGVWATKPTMAPITTPLKSSTRIDPRPKKIPAAKHWKAMPMLLRT